MLAVATFMLIRHSEKQEERRREYEQQNRDEDKERDFRRRLLDDVFRWAHEATVSVNAIQGVKSRKDLKNILPNLEAALTYFRDAGTAIDTSKDFFGEAFIKLVYETLDNFKAYVDLLEQKDLDSYVPPDPDLDWRYDKLRQVIKRFKGERAVIAHVIDVFHVAKEHLLGDVAYFKAMKRNPDFVDRANEIVTNYHLRYLNNCLDLGADIVLVSGDWAMSKGPMVSPEFTTRFLAPPLQKFAELAHSRGVPCLKHTDGNIWPIYDIIIDAGVDGIHPIDPLAGMDIGEAKAVFGDKVCLMGNVNCATNLCTGTIEDVREETKEVIRKAGKGGGLICLSSNSIHSGVKPENYVAMVKAIREYGNYPLNFV